MTDATPIHRSSWLSDAQRERFWAKIDKNGPIPDISDPLITSPATPCWEWTAARNSDTGYGAFVSPPPRKGKTAQAHRIMYMEVFGPVADGMHIDHMCRNRGCVNPEHLRCVTHQENILAGATVPAMRAKITHCPQGHEYTPENTEVSKRRQRHCKTCRRARSEAFRATHRAEINARAAIYRAANREQIRERQREARARRAQENPSP